MAPSDNDFRLPSTSRRSFLGLSAAASAAFALRIVTEPMLAHARPHNYPKDAIRIDANENPLGPCASAREAAAAIVPQGGRYSDWLTDDLVKTLAEMEGLKVEQVRVYAGSSEPLHHTVAAFTSAQRSYVTADPGYEAGIFTAQAIGAKVVKVPLTKTYAHDVKAMLAAAPDAGVFYVCSPNNPTGTLTSHADIEYLVENKPKGSVVLVDEAYIHFSDAVSVMDLVRAGKDVILLRTFSKIYGMAGLRCGAVFARPDLMEKVENYGGWNFMPITAMVGRIGQPERRATGARAQAHQRHRPRPGLCLARPQRILLHSLGIELLHAGHETAGEGGDRCHGQAEGDYWTHLAGVANVHAHHGWDCSGDGAVPGGLAEGDDGGGDG